MVKKQPSVKTDRIYRALKVLSETNQCLIRVNDEKEFLAGLCGIIVNTGGYHLAWVGRALDDEKKTVNVISHAGPASSYIRSLEIHWADDEYGRGPTGTAIRTNSVAIVRNIEHDPAYGPWREAAMKFGFASSIALPVKIGRKRFGALNIYAVEPDAFDSDETVLLRKLADDLSFGLQVLRERVEAQRATLLLEKSERKYREIFNAAPVGIFRASATGHLLEVNPEMARIIGFRNPDDAAEQSNRGDGMFSGAAGQSELLQLIRKNGEVFGFEYSVPQNDGKLAWFVLNARITELPAGEESVIDGFVQDITERKLVENRLRESETLYKNLFNNNHAVMLLLDPETHRIRDVNPAAVRFYGWPYETLTSMRIDDINTMSEQAIEHEIELAVHEKRNHHIFRHRRADGSVRDIEVYSSLISLQGKSVLYAIIHDITDKKRTELALRAGEERYRLLAETARDFIIVTDSSGRIRYANPAASGFLKRGIQEMSLFSVVPADAVAGFMQYLGTVARVSGSMQLLTTELISADGSLMPVEVNASVLRNIDGNEGDLLLVIRDISAHVSTERALMESLRERETLIRELYHRTKNNMQIIASMLSLERRENSDPRMVSVLKELESKIQTMSLVHQKLYRSRNLSRIDLKEYIEELGSLVLETLGTGGKKISIVYDLIPSGALIDTVIPLGLVLNELLTNALKHGFADRSDGIVTITLRQVHTGKCMLVVSNNGKRFPGKISLAGGINLGLQTVCALVEQQLSGTIRLDKDPETTFSILFTKDLDKE